MATQQNYINNLDTQEMQIAAQSYSKACTENEKCASTVKSDIQNAANTVSNANTGSSGAGSLSMMSGSAAALAFVMLAQLLAEFAQITQEYQQAQAMQLNTQAETAKCQAQATENAGEALGSSMQTAGWMTIGGALLSAGVTLGGLTMAAKGANAQLDQLGEEMAPLKAVDNAFSKASLDGDVNGGAQVDGEPAVYHIEDDEVTTLAKKIKDGNFTKEDVADDDLLQSAVDRLHTISEARSSGTTIEGATADEFGEFDINEVRAQNTRRLTARTSQYQGVMQAKSSKEMVTSTMGQALNSSAQGLSSFVQGSGQQEQGVQNAISQLMGSASQVAGSTAQSLQQGQSNAAQALEQLVQAFQAYIQTSSLR